MTDKKYADREIYSVIVKAPIETVWSELIEATKPRPFFWNSNWDPDPLVEGGAYRMIWKEKNSVAVIGEVLEMQPPNLLVTSFRLTALPDPPSKVIYKLRETPAGVEFQLITENIVAGSKSEKSMDGGARFIVKNLKAYVETGRVTFGARLTLAMYSLMSPIAPKSMRAENWPLKTA